MRAADVRVSPGAPSLDEESAARPYTVISISVYSDQLAHMDSIVGELKRSGYTKANRSLVLRALFTGLTFSQIAQLVSRQLGKDFR